MRSCDTKRAENVCGLSQPNKSSPRETHRCVLSLFYLGDTELCFLGRVRKQKDQDGTHDAGDQERRAHCDSLVAALAPRGTAQRHFALRPGNAGALFRLTQHHTMLRRTLAGCSTPFCNGQFHGAGAGGDGWCGVRGVQGGECSMVYTRIKSVMLQGIGCVCGVCVACFVPCDPSFRAHCWPHTQTTKCGYRVCRG